MRRTVWDGSAELYEIQMPGSDSSAYLETDTDLPEFPLNTEDGINHFDPNPFFGRVLYTYGLTLDQPLSIIRMNYGDRLTVNNVEAGYRALPPFSIIPLWDERGQPHAGVFEDGGLKKCEGSGSTERCVYLSWRALWFAYARPQFRPSFWHGSLIHDKQEHAGTHFRRNRYYDPETGKFAQEDPIGLAGGIICTGLLTGTLSTSMIRSGSAL